MQTVDQFIRFCTDNKGKQVDTSSLTADFPECTPEYIAKMTVSKE